MTSKDHFKTPSTIAERLKARREMLGISQKDVAEHLDISIAEIERYEGQQSSAITTAKPKKYIVEIYDPERKRLGARELDLFHFDGINLLLEELKSAYNYVVEFCARIKPGGKLFNEFDKVYHEDNNVLEITSIKKVKNNNKS